MSFEHYRALAEAQQAQLLALEEDLERRTVLVEPSPEDNVGMSPSQTPQSETFDAGITVSSPDSPRDASYQQVC